MRRLLTALGAAAALIGGALSAYSCLLRPRHLRWGATPAEVAGEMPGDDLIPHPRVQTTRAVAIDAPADVVWPWLIQIGTDRAGWYSYDFLENAMGLGVHSAEQIVPEYQSLAVGDVIRAAPPPYLGFTVRSIDCPRSLVTSTSIDVIKGVCLEPGDLASGRRVDTSWSFVLEPAGERSCRLIARLRASYAPSPVTSVAMMGVVEPAHFAMERKMLLGIKQRAEASARREAASQ